MSPLVGKDWFAYELDGGNTLILGVFEDRDERAAEVSYMKTNITGTVVLGSVHGCDAHEAIDNVREGNWYEEKI